MQAAERDIHEEHGAVQPDICACVCTHNGQAVLGACLESLARQGLERDRFSVLVVDDGSTDETAAVYDAWHQMWPAVRARLVWQEATGLSAARNLGLKQSDAPLVAYIDDDAMASPGWLTGLIEGFARFGEAAGAVGGPVSVRWTANRPRWWRSELDEVFNRFDAGAEVCLVRFPRLPYGCNFAVRRDTAMQLGGFRTDLGRQKGQLLGGEETELLLRMGRSGIGVGYWPGARVEHMALPQRANRRYVLRRAWMHGRSLGRLSHVYAPVSEAMPGLSGCLWQMVWTAGRYRGRLSHWKYWLLRLGYHWERRRGGKAAAARQDALVSDPMARSPGGS